MDKAGNLRESIVGVEKRGARTGRLRKRIGWKCHFTQVPMLFLSLRSHTNFTRVLPGLMQGPVEMDPPALKQTRSSLSFSHLPISSLASESWHREDIPRMQASALEQLYVIWRILRGFFSRWRNRTIHEADWSLLRK